MRIIILITVFVFTTQVFSQTAAETNNGILWIGMENPVTIMDKTLERPLLKSSDASASLNSEEIFMVMVTDESNGKTIQLDLYDSLSTGNKKISSYYYLVKRIPPPVFSIAGKLIHDTISRSDLLKTKTINVAIDDVDFKHNLRFEVQSFSMEIDGNEFQSNSNKLTPSMIHYITNATGNMIRIRNDRTVMVAGGDRVPRCVLVGCDKTFVLVE